MSDATRDLAALEDSLQLASLRFWLGLEPCLDVLALLREQGLDEPDRVRDDPEQPAWLRRVVAAAPHLLQATQALGQLQLPGRGVVLDADALLRELEATSSPSHLEAMARALHDGRAAALHGPLDLAAIAVRDLLDEPAPPPVTGLDDGEARELARALPGGRDRPSRLTRALQASCPVPVEAWRAQLRPLLDALLAPVGASLGVSLQRSARGVPVLAARHPGRPGRWVLHLRPSTSRSVERAFAVRCGEVVARALGQAPARLGGLFAAQLGATALWRRAGLGASQARELALELRRDLLRWVLRLQAYGSAGEDDARAWAACAAERLHERDDLFGALLWRGPLPDPSGLPAQRSALDLQRVAAEVLDGIRLQQVLVERVGDDWHRAPEAAEALREVLALDPPPFTSAPLWSLLDG